LSQRWDALRDAPDTPGIERAQVGERERGDGPHAVGRPVDRAVVDDDQLAIAAALHVAFDGLRAQVEGEIEGQQGVFGRVSPRAAMGIADHLLAVTHVCPIFACGPLTPPCAYGSTRT